MTLKWWNQAQTEDYDPEPLHRYAEYYNSVKNSLPASFVALHEDLNLHDGELYECSATDDSRGFTLKVLRLNENGSKTTIRLEYQEVSSFELRANKNLGLPGPLGFGDIGYHEVEVLGHNYRHSIITSSGIELNIVCKNLIINLQ